MRRLLVFLFLSTRAFGAFSYYRTLTIDHTKCGASDSSHFPVLVSISHATLKTVGNGGHIGHTTNQSSPSVTMPADLIFSADSAGATKYPWEVASYDGTNGVLVAWVKIPTVSHTTDTVFYLLYGDSAVSTAQNTGTLAPSNVWDSNHSGVWHYHDGTTLSTVDSTSNANTETSHSGTAASGKIDGAIAFNGSQNLIYPDSASLRVGTALTIELWVYANDAGSTHLVILDKRSSGGGNGYFLGFNGSAYNVEYYLKGTVNANDSYWTRGPFPTGAWHHLVATYASPNMLVYLDGSPLGCTFACYAVDLGNMDDAAAPLRIADLQGGSGLGMNGKVDELRISNIARPAAWILTEYNNQSAPGNIGADNFLKYGAESTPPPPAGGMIRHRISGGE